MPAPHRGSSVYLLAVIAAVSGAPASAYQTQACPDCQDDACSTCPEVACSTCGESGAPDALATGTDPWWTLYSDASPQNRVLFGMWSYHLRDLSSGAPSNGLIGIVYNGMMAATFLTTHGPRGYALGIERTWLSVGWGPTEVMLGYRAGLVHGYDGRLFRFAEMSPIIPFLQPVAFVRSGPFTFDATYTYVVVSFTAGFRL